jgi:hypothetical protein
MIFFNPPGFSLHLNCIFGFGWLPENAQPKIAAAEADGSVSGSYSRKVKG